MRYFVAGRSVGGLYIGVAFIYTAFVTLNFMYDPTGLIYRGTRSETAPYVNQYKDKLQDHISFFTQTKPSNQDLTLRAWYQNYAANVYTSISKPLAYINSTTIGKIISFFYHRTIGRIDPSVGYANAIFYALFGFPVIWLLYTEQGDSTLVDEARRPPTNITILFISSIIGSLFFVYLLRMVLGTAIDTESRLSNIPFTFLNIALLIGLLALIVAILQNYIFDTHESKNSQMFKLLANIVLYIPCLVVYVVEACRREYKISTKPSIIILAINVLIIMAHLSYSSTSKAISKLESGYKLVDKPVYLDSSIDLGGNPWGDSNRDSLTTYSPGVTNYKELVFPQQFANSFFLYLGQDQKYVNKDFILYNNCERIFMRFNPYTSSFSVQLNIKCSTTCELKTIYETKLLPMQKWNHFVINYNSGTVDVFLNGAIVATWPPMEYTGQVNLIDPKESSTLVLGQPDGLRGSIKNFIFYNYNLSSLEIGSLHNSS